MITRYVTPLVGVWIEIAISQLIFTYWPVTPLVGVWIEMYRLPFLCIEGGASLPLWECGLKYLDFFFSDRVVGHSPCGSVD